MFGRKRVPSKREWSKILEYAGSESSGSFWRPREVYESKELTIFSSGGIPEETKKKLEGRGFGVKGNYISLVFATRNESLRENILYNLGKRLLEEFRGNPDYVVFGDPEINGDVKVYRKNDKNLFAYVGIKEIRRISSWTGTLLKDWAVIVVLERGFPGKEDLLYRALEESYKQYKEQKKK